MWPATWRAATAFACTGKTSTSARYTLSTPYVETDAVNLFTFASELGPTDEVTLSGECLGVHAARLEAMEPLRQAICRQGRKIRLRRRRGPEDRAGRHGFVAFADGVAAGTRLRHDHGSRFVADDFRREVDFLGLARSPTFVREPEGHGCVERCIRVLEENLLWLGRFDTVEDLRRALHTFKDAYNRGWILQRHGNRTPAQVRPEQTAVARAA